LSGIETLIEVSESDRSFSSYELKQSKTTQTTNSKRDENLKKKAIVLDITGGLIKVGFAGENAPSVVFPTLIGCPKYV
jgi:DNA-binding protein YbaB